MFVTLRSMMLSLLCPVMVCPCVCQVTCLPLSSWSLANIGCGARLHTQDQPVIKVSPHQLVIDSAVLHVQFTVHFPFDSKLQILLNGYIMQNIVHKGKKYSMNLSEQMVRYL